MKQRFIHAIECGSDWTDISSDVMPGLYCYYGNQIPTRTQRIGQIGRLQFALDNDSKIYSPGSTNARPGFGIGAKVRWSVQRQTEKDPLTFPWTFPLEFTSKPDTFYKFRGKIENIDIAPDEYGQQLTFVTVADWFKDASQMVIANVPAQANKRIDQVVTGYFSDIETLPDDYSLETGENIFTYAGQAGGSKTRLLSELRRLAASEPSYIYMRGGTGSQSESGSVLVVENRSSRDQSSDLEATVQTGLVDIGATRDRDEIKNDVRVTVHPSVVDTNETAIYTLEADVEIPPRDTLVFSGRYQDSDTPNQNFGAYDLWISFLVDWTDSDRFGLTTNAIESRILEQSTNIYYYWKLGDTDGLDAFNSDRDISVTGSPTVTSDGYGGLDYLLLDNDSDVIVNTDLAWNLEKGTIVSYYFPISTPVAASDNVAASDGGSTDIYYSRTSTWLSTNTSDGGEFTYEVERKDSGVPAYQYYDNVTLTFNDSDQNARIWSTAASITSDWQVSGTDWIQHAIVWDYKFGTTDTMKLEMYVNGVLKADLAGTAGSATVPAKKPSSDIVWGHNVAGLYSRASDSFGVAHYALFDTDLSASDLLYVHQPSTDIGITYSVAGGTAPQITAVNDLYVPVFLQNLVVNGRKLTDLDPVTIQVADSDSIASYGVSVYNLDMVYQDSPSVARAVASDELAALKDPQSQVGYITFIANYDTDLGDYFLNVEPGDRVAVVEDQTAIAASDHFIVNGAQYRQFGQDLVEVKWIVYPA